MRSLVRAARVFLVASGLFACGHGGTGSNPTALCPEAVGSFNLTDDMSAPGVPSSCGLAQMCSSFGNGCTLVVAADPTKPSGIGVTSDGYACSGTLDGCTLAATCAYPNPNNGSTSTVRWTIDLSKVSGTLDLSTTDAKGTCAYHFDESGTRQ
jgi:hypothetical protein